MNEPFADSLRVSVYATSPAKKKRREGNDVSNISKLGESSLSNFVPVVRSDAVLRLIAGSKRSWSTVNTAHIARTLPRPLFDGTATNDILHNSLRATSFVTRLGSHNFALCRGNSSAAMRGGASVDEGELVTALDALGPFAFHGDTSTASPTTFSATPIPLADNDSTTSAINDCRKRSVNGGGDGGKHTASSSSSVVILPPYEYCSMAMLNQARFGRNVYDTLTDKGGTVKNVLQSSKSFMHYLTTYPLKNTFRGYIQIRPYLLPHDIGLPAHHATQIFGIDRHRDRALVAAWRPNYCTSPKCRTTRRRCRDCPYWPDESFEYCFDTTRNFSLILKRDPCIHNGSVVAIRRIYVTYGLSSDANDVEENDRADDNEHRGARAAGDNESSSSSPSSSLSSKRRKRIVGSAVRDPRSDNVAGNDSIYVSSFILKNLNADFDGDAVTVMIVRGIESSCELEQCMLDEPLLYGACPRFTFSQSLVYRLFCRLCFDDDHDETRARKHIARTIETLLETRGSLNSLRSYVRQFLFDRLNLEDDVIAATDGSLDEGTTIFNDVNHQLRSASVAAARKRALAIFGGRWYPYYARVSKRVLFVGDQREEDLWSRALWCDTVLDATYVAAIRDGRADRDDDSAENLLERLLQQARGTGDDDDDATSYFLDENILCLQNWIIVHSGAKGSPLELWNLHERFVRAFGNERSAVESRPLLPQADFWRRCSRERANDYRRYLDDFVNVSKNVPKGSYFASGLKWVMQTCRVLNGDFVMGDRRLLSDLAYYTQGVYRDFL